MFESFVGIAIAEYYTFLDRQLRKISTISISGVDATILSEDKKVKLGMLPEIENEPNRSRT